MIDKLLIIQCVSSLKLMFKIRAYRGKEDFMPVTTRAREGRLYPGHYASISQFTKPL